MTYLSDRKRNRNNYKVYGGIIFALFVFVYTWSSIQKMVHPYTEQLAVKYGVTKSFTQVLPASITTFFSSKYTLASKNNELERIIERLENDLAEKDGKYREVASLLEGGAATGTPVIVMYPLMVDISKVYSTILLSKGFKDGVTENAVVYLRGRQSVCNIKEVYTNTSICRLFSAYGENIEGVVGGITLFMKGDGGGAYTAEIPRGSTISIGDVVYLKQDQTMTLGRVSDILRDDQAAFWKVYISGGYNPTTSHIFYTNE